MPCIRARFSGRRSSVRPGSPWRSLCACFGVLLVVGGAGGLAVDVGAQEAFRGSFELSARGDTMYVQFVDPNFPLFPGGEVVGVSPASASALVNSIGRSQAFAGAPYAGDTVSTLPGTVNGLGGGKLPPLPNTMPGYLASSFPDDAEPAPQDLGTYALAASSSPTSSTAESRFGATSSDPNVLTVEARAKVEAHDDGSGVARAEARVAPFAVGGLLSIGEVHATATATLRASGEVDLKSTLDIGTLTVGGVRLGLTDKGLEAGPLGIIPAADVATLSQLLAGSGYSIELLPATSNENTVTSAGLKITYETDVPTQGTVTTTVYLGRVTATARSVAFGLGPFPVDEVTAPPPVASVDSGAVGDSVGQTPMVSSAPGPVPSAAGPLSGAAVERPRPIVSLTGVDLGAAFADFYLVLILGGLAAVAASRATGLLAVRSSGGRTETGQWRRTPRR